MNAQVALAWIGAHVDLAVIVLVVLLAASAWVIWKAQKRQDFDFAQMLRDADGKPSGLRMSVLGCFAISSWAVMHDVLAGTLTDGQFWAYLVVWSGAKVADTAVAFWQKGRRDGDPH